MIYLEVNQHHPLTILKDYTYFMFHEDYVFCWRDEPIYWSEQEKCFIRRVRDRDNEGSYCVETLKYDIDCSLEPELVWYKGRFLEWSYRPIIALETKYGWTGTNLNDYTPLRDKRELNLEFVTLQDDCLKRFIEMEQLFNTKVDVSIFEKWCVNELQLQGFTLKHSGPLNLFQILKFHKIIDPKDSEKEIREYELSSTEEWILKGTRVGVKPNQYGFYSNQFEKLFWLSDDLYKVEG